MPPHNETTPLTKDARSAFSTHDLEASKNYHDSRPHSSSYAEEAHQSHGDYLKAIIFGGLDGILTSFALVSGATGGSLSPGSVLIMGFSNIFADALSMGVGEFLSSKAHNDWVLSERRREVWELENYPEGEVQEMIDIYVERGMEEPDARMVIEKMAKYKEFFVDVMMAEELQLQVPEDTHRSDSMKEGCVMFTSFALFGLMPLLGYVIIPSCFPSLDESALFISACVTTGVVLFVMGCVKSVFSTSNFMVSGMETLMLGGACASVAYWVGQYVESRVGEEE